MMTRKKPTIFQNNYNVLVFKQRRGSHLTYVDFSIMWEIVLQIEICMDCCEVCKVGQCSDFTSSAFSSRFIWKGCYQAKEREKSQKLLRVSLF